MDGWVFGLSSKQGEKGRGGGARGHWYVCICLPEAKKVDRYKRKKKHGRYYCVSN